MPQVLSATAASTCTIISHIRSGPRWTSRENNLAVAYKVIYKLSTYFLQMAADYIGKIFYLNLTVVLTGIMQ